MISFSGICFLKYLCKWKRSTWVIPVLFSKENNFILRFEIILLLKFNQNFIKIDPPELELFVSIYMKYFIS